MLKKENKNSSEYLGVILEDINSKFDIIKEGHIVLSEQVEKLNNKVDKFGEKVDRNHQEFVEFKEETKSNFQTVFDLLSNIDDDIKDVKSELEDIKKTLTNKADLDRVGILEKRVKILEIKLLELRAV